MYLRRTGCWVLRCLQSNMAFDMQLGDLYDGLSRANPRHNGTTTDICAARIVLLDGVFCWAFGLPQSSLGRTRAMYRAYLLTRVRIQTPSHVPRG